MTEFKSKEEAMEAAEKHAIDLIMGNEGFSVNAIHTDGIVRVIHKARTWACGHSKDFTYPKPKPTPKKGTPILDLNNGALGYSSGESAFGTGVKAAIYSGNQHEYACFKDFEPVEIVRNGEHKRAIELLGVLANSLNDYTNITEAAEAAKLHNRWRKENGWD